MGLFLALPSLFLAYEAFRLIRDVFSMFSSNQTLVESYKKVWGRSQKRVTIMKEFLGPRRLYWAIPFYLPQEKTYAFSDLMDQSSSENEVEELTYADEYIYGKDD